jgi:hypothetical protein
VEPDELFTNDIILCALSARPLARTIRSSPMKRLARERGGGMPGKRAQIRKRKERKKGWSESRKAFSSCPFIATNQARTSTVSGMGTSNASSLVEVRAGEVSGSENISITAAENILARLCLWIFGPRGTKAEMDQGW